jgi:glutamate N-acetyltransferase/amino-acid N-acetyltransferase
LCKTAFFGEDANWGRIACAAGYSGVKFFPEDLCILLGDLPVVEEGLPTLFDEGAAKIIMSQRDIVVTVSLGSGAGSAIFWTSDLSHAYVTINADYRT